MPDDVADVGADRVTEVVAAADDEVGGADVGGDADLTGASALAGGSDVPEDRAVVDRVVDGVTAVLHVGPAGAELLVPAHQLPSDATEGTWLVLDLAVEPVVVVGVDRELTAARSAAVSGRMERLRRTRGGGRFDR